MTRARRILMLAPEPFFEPRGTPFSEYHRIKVLGELGYSVDLVTYPFGHDVSLPNLRIFRSLKPPFIRGVRIGPSKVKLLLDSLLTITAIRVAVAGRYDAIHSHEEAGVLGVILAKLLGIPHLYDMHSSLPQQLDNFAYTRSRFVRHLFDRAERMMVGGSRVVITICQELQDAVVAAGAGDRSFLIENVMGGDIGDEEPSVGHSELNVRDRYGIGKEQPLILYTGTFEEYQGLGLLLEAATELSLVHRDARILIVGGQPEQVEAARARMSGGQHASGVIFAGQRPPQEVPYFIEACDILVSPRISGTNTPLKIYSYLRSGRPIVATNLRTHTQVLARDTALLVEPEASAFAAGIQRLIENPDEATGIAMAASAVAKQRYSRRIYIARTAEAYRLLLGKDALPGTLNGDP